MDIQNYTIIDLTHDIHSNIPTWDMNCWYHIKTIRDYHQWSTNESEVRIQMFDMRGNTGTHIDAPSHFVKGGTTVNQIPLNDLIAPCVMINIAHKALDEHSIISVNDIAEFEKKYGIIQSKSFVLFYTGWSRFWHEPKKYLNNMLFPSISKEAAQFLLDRNISGLGTDTFSPDNHTKGSFVHELILGANKYLVENIAHANQLPPVGATIFIIPLKLQDAVESPIRLWAMVPKNTKVEQLTNELKKRVTS